MSKQENNNIITMKLLINKNNQKVLFAEAGKDSVDFLFHILSIPLGTIVSYLSKESMVGSIGNIYGSLESLQIDYVEDNLKKQSLLGASVSNTPTLLTMVNETNDLNKDTGFITYYGCKEHFFYSDTYGVKCPDSKCKRVMDQTLSYVAPSYATTSSSSSRFRGYVKGVVTYMITDDLCIQPMSTISSIAILNKFGVTDVTCLEERDVTFDMNVGKSLLKASMMSKTVLTDVFMPMKNI